MDRKKTFTLGIYSVAALILFAVMAGPLTVSASSYAVPDSAYTASGPVASVTLNEGRLEFEPNDSTKGVGVSVSGADGANFSTTAAPGEAPIFELIDDEGNAFPDGPANFEIWAIPETSEREDDSVDRTVRQVQSGAFSVVDGAIVFGAGGGGGPIGDSDPSTGGFLARDQVILDDLIVDGSACVGQDCVNGESFGFDTLKLKENNLRIKFDDTSTSASFPNRDWQITINDSSNGGANKFSIDDVTGGRTPFTIEAAAPNNSLFVEDSGEIGFGTSNPVVNLHVVEGNTPTLRLEQDGSSGFTAQTWDLAGNEANFFIRDVTSGSRLSFRIRPGAPESSIDIQSDGDVGIGTSSPKGALHVQKSGSANQADGYVSIFANTAAASDNAIALLQSGNTGQTTLNFGDTDKQNVGYVKYDHSSDKMIFRTNGTDIFEIRSDGSIWHRGASLHADYVFNSDYQLESIEEHADYMWENKHLKAVPKSRTDETGMEIISMGAHRKGMLEELEKAHIYIEQLSQKNKDLENRLEKIESLITERQ